MKTNKLRRGVSRRGFLKLFAATAFLSGIPPFPKKASTQTLEGSDLFWVTGIPAKMNGNYHPGIDGLLSLMGTHGLKLYRSASETAESGTLGMIASHDVVLIKVNAQWKYRGCTNSDLIRGLIQRVLDHPDGFTGEIVIFENGQGRGSLRCDTMGSSDYPYGVHANAEDESHSFVYLVDNIFIDQRVSYYLLDDIRTRIISPDDHTTDGYRTYENVSYPCFTSHGGHRVELQEGIWNGSTHDQNLKLINVPVLKHHDTGGSEITASLKHFYGVLSMADGQSDFRHYSGLGETCGKMIVSVRTPILNIIDAIWVSQDSITGYPENTATRVNQILAGQDPVSLDYWAAKYILYPIDTNERHHPNFSGIATWLTGAALTINDRGGLHDPDRGIFVRNVTNDESKIATYELSLGFIGDGSFDMYFDTVQKAYIGYYQRPADPAGLLYWAGRLAATNGNLNEIIEAYANSAESQALYGPINSGNISNVINAIYRALFNRDAEPGGLAWYINRFNSGQYTAATIMLNVLDGAQNQDLQSVNNKLAAANLFTRTIDPELDGLNFEATYAGNNDAIKARTFLSSVTSDQATIPDQDAMTSWIKSNISDPGDPILSH
jgi:hypothetical protein